MNLRRLTFLCTAVLFLICGIGYGGTTVAAEKAGCARLRNYTVCDETMQEGMESARLRQFDFYGSSILFSETEVTETNLLRRLGSSSEQVEIQVRSSAFFFLPEHSGTREVFEEKLPPDSYCQLPEGRAPPFSCC